MFGTSFAAKCLVLILLNWQTGFSVSAPQETENSKVYYRDQELGHKIRCTAISGEKGSCLSHSECYQSNGRHSQLLCAAPVAQLICCIPRNITDQQFSLSKKPGQEDVSIGLASDTGIVDNIFNINNQNSNNQWRTTTTYRPHLTTRYTTPRALSTKRPQEFSYQFEKSTPVPQYSPPSTFRPSFQSNNIPNRKVVIAPNLQKPISNQEGLVTNNFGGAQRPTSVSQSNSPSRPSASFGGSNDAAEGTCKRVNADNINAFNKNFWDVLDYPHVVAVGIHRVINGRSQQTWKCVGSIIHENYILASASCIRNDDPRKPEQEVNVILITDRNLNNSYEDDKLERITKISYNGEIALIKLQRKLEFHRYARPACFLDGSLEKTANLLRSTWLRKPVGDQQVPHKDSLTIESLQTCSRFYGNAITSDNLCAQLVQPNEHNCEILSSPLFLANMELTTAYGDPIALYYLVAVESLIKPSHCSWPILYSYVSSYKSWIEREVLK